jgi:hypothetical protein
MKRHWAFLLFLIWPQSGWADDWIESRGESTSMRSLEISDSLDRYPSLGFSANYSPLTGYDTANRLNLQFQDLSLMSDFRFPASNVLTLDVGFGYRSIDYGKGSRVDGASYSAGARIYFR